MAVPMAVPAASMTLCLFMHLQATCEQACPSWYYLHDLGGDAMRSVCRSTGISWSHCGILYQCHDVHRLKHCCCRSWAATHGQPPTDLPMHVTMHHA